MIIIFASVIMSESSSMMNELHEKYNLSVEKSKSQSMSTKKRMVKTICMSLSMVGVVSRLVLYLITTNALPCPVMNCPM